MTPERSEILLVAGDLAFQEENTEAQKMIQNIQGYIEVNKLSSIEKTILNHVYYNKKDILVKPVALIDLEPSCGFAGQRGFSWYSLNKDNINYGPWGGYNSFSKKIDYPKISLELGDSVIKGTIGNKVFATIYKHPIDVANLLPKKEEISDKEKKILYCYAAIKSGKYRKEELSRVHANEIEVLSLVERGFLKKDKRGIQITTKGKDSYK